MSGLSGLTFGSTMDPIDLLRSQVYEYFRGCEGSVEFWSALEYLKCIERAHYSGDRVNAKADMERLRIEARRDGNRVRQEQKAGEFASMAILCSGRIDRLREYAHLVGWLPEALKGLNGWLVRMQAATAGDRPHWNGLLEGVMRLDSQLDRIYASYPVQRAIYGVEDVEPAVRERPGFSPDFYAPASRSRQRSHNSGERAGSVLSQTVEILVARQPASSTELGRIQPQSLEAKKKVIDHGAIARERTQDAVKRAMMTPQQRQALREQEAAASAAV